MATVSLLDKGSFNPNGSTNASFGGDSKANDWAVMFTVGRTGTSAGYFTQFASMNMGFTSISHVVRGYYYQFLNDATFSLSVSGVDVSFIAFRIRPANGKRIALKATANSGNQSFLTTTPSLAVPGEMTDQSLIFGAQGIGDDTYFTDSDTTNGTWSSVTFETSANYDRGVAAQHKFVTASGNQTYNGTLSSSEYAGLMTMNFVEGDLGYWGVQA